MWEKKQRNGNKPRLNNKGMQVMGGKVQVTRECLTGMREEGWVTAAGGAEKPDKQS